MKYIKRLLYPLLIIVAASTIYSQSQNTPDRILNFSGNIDYPPFEFIDKDNKPSGFNIELLETISKKADLEININLDIWSTALENLNSGKLDALTGTSYSPDRANLYAFSAPYNQIEVVIVVRSNNRVIKSEKDLIDKQVIVQNQDVMHEYVLRKNLAQDIIVVPGQTEAIHLLASGRHDAILMPRLQAQYYTKQLGLRNIKIVPDYKIIFDYSFAVLRENRSFLDIFDDTLLALKESGEYQEIYDRWFSEYTDGGITVELIFRYAVIFLILMMIIAVIVFRRYLTLKSKIDTFNQKLLQESEAHKKTALSLQESRGCYQYLVDNVSDVVVRTDMNGLISYANHNLQTVFGYSAIEIIDKMHLADLIVPNDHNRLRGFYKMLPEGNRHYIQLTGIRRDGKETHLLLFASVINDPDTGPYFLGLINDYCLQKRHQIIQKTMYDISEAAQTTDKIDELFSKIHTAVGQLTPVENFYIALFDEDSNLLSFPYFKSVAESKPKPRRPGKGITEYVMRTGQPLLADSKMLTELYKNEEIESIENIAAIWLGIPLKVQNKVNGLIAVQDYNNQMTYDETDKLLLTFVSEQIASAIYRKQTEEIRQRHNSYFRELFNNIPAGVVLTDKNNLLLNVNQAFLDMFDYKIEEVINRNITDLIVPEELQNEANNNYAISLKGTVVKTETHRKTKSGKLLNVQFFNVPVTVNDKQEATYGIYLNTTELHQANSSLLIEKERLQVMLSSIGDGVIATDNNRKIVMINDIACKLTGWTEKKAIGRYIEDVFIIFNETTRDNIENIVKTVIETETMMHLSNHTILQSRDGKEYIVEDSAAPIKDKDGYLIGVILVFRDTTEKRRLEDELHRNAKLESIGILAGGIAHDFNNILAVIIGNITLARQMCNDPAQEKIRERMLEAEKASLRAKTLTQQLLTYSKGGEPVKIISTVGVIIEETVTFATHGSKVSKYIETVPGLWNIEADAGQISQVIKNLTINALQAMSDEGRLIIKAQNEILKTTMFGTLKPGKYVTITIADNGHGISREHLNNIFDPFFTTKTNGTGLGVTTSMNIIKKHQGYMTVESTFGEGTTFKIYLPASEIVLEETQAFKLSGQEKCTVLLMDDDKDLVDVVTEMLENLGYSVTSTKDGSEAITKYREMLDKITPFDLVILDLTVPGGMGGKDTVKEILALDPEACCIVSSGYSSDPVMANYKAYGFKAVLSKPYSFKELSNTLARFTV